MSDGSRRMSVSGPSEFLRALYDGCEGVIELRALERRGAAARTFIAPGDDPETLRVFLRDHEHDKVYFGVATRKDSSGGDLAHCLRLPALFVDVDFKTTPVGQAREAIRRFPLKPSIVVQSGGGVHPYWLLREPMDLREEAPRAKDLLRRLAIHLIADLGAAEPARVLRLPGTSNFKYVPPRPVTLARIDAERRFNPMDFDSLLPAEAHNVGGEPRFVAPELIAAGTRNATLYKLGRSLKSRGLSEAEILATLLAVNAQRCQPRLGDAEIRAIAHQAATQRDHPEFAGRPRRRFSVEVL